MVPRCALLGRGSSRVVLTVLDSARFQWEEGYRRLAEEKSDPVRYGQLCDLVDVVVARLRRRVGQRFTLSELARAHSGSEDWVREIIRESLPPKARVGVRDTALVHDAAFNAYARGAIDYRF